MFLTQKIVTFSAALLFQRLLTSFRAHQAVTTLGELCCFPGVCLLLLYRTKIVAFCLNGCAILPFKSESGGMWCETEPHAPAWAVHRYQFHGSWQRWGHFPMTLRNKVKLKRQFCTFWGCCTPAPCRRKAGDVVLVFQRAGGSGMFWALLEREQMLHKCNRKSRMLLYITDFPQCFGKDHWPKQMWKKESGIMKYVSIMNI